MENISGFTLKSVSRTKGSQIICPLHPKHRCCQASLRSKSQHNALPSKKQTGDSFVLPIFPLRKSVKLPCEALTLNLYEPRYLELAEYVLDMSGKPSRWFGGMHCSKKPQFIREGDGPIVPMVEPGDVGVVCDVLYDEEGMVPGDDGAPQRRIKLKALAIGRFRIEKVLQNGYGGRSLWDEDEKTEPLPFILVEASRIDDAPIIRGSKEENDVVELEAKVYKLMKARDRLKDELLANLWGCLLSDVVSDRVKADELLNALLPAPLDGGVESTLSMDRSQEVEAIDKSLSSWINPSIVTALDQRRQIFSFAACSIAAPEKRVTESLPLLKGTSTYERLMYTHEKLKRSQSWLSIFSML